MLIDVLLIISFFGLLTTLLLKMYFMANKQNNEIGISLVLLFLPFIFFGLVMFATMSKAVDYKSGDITKSEMLFSTQLNNMAWILFLINFFFSLIDLVFLKVFKTLNKDRLRRSD